MTSLASALAWTERLSALALVLQSVELLQLRSVFADDGVWRWSILQREHAGLPAPLRWLFAQLLPYPRFVALLWLRLPLSFALGFGVLPAAPLLLVSHLAVAARFRGSFNGGSDYMTSVLLLSLSLAACSTSAQVTTVALGYVCTQLVLSYFVAGLVKLTQPAWRSGRALVVLVASTRFLVRDIAFRQLSRPRVARLAALSVMAFECGFPLALVGRRSAAFLLAIGALFHLVNARVLGLNRFFFAWVAAYPALYYFATRVFG